MEEKKRGKVIYPPEEEIYRAFEMTPFERVKVVIVGQDPYHGEGQADGLAFSVKEGTKIPPSLKNIYKELQVSGSGSLVNLAKQGVLLLNSSLTVRAKEPLSHQGIGWEKFTDRIIFELSQSTKPLVFLLWGKFAEKKGALIGEPHLVLKAPHPSPYSASKGFFGCGHFPLANEALKKWGEEIIDWTR